MATRRFKRPNSPHFAAQPGLWLTADERFILFRHPKKDSYQLTSGGWHVIANSESPSVQEDRLLLATNGINRTHAFPSRNEARKAIGLAVYGM